MEKISRKNKRILWFAAAAALCVGLLYAGSAAAKLQSAERQTAEAEESQTAEAAEKQAGETAEEPPAGKQTDEASEEPPTGKQTDEASEEPPAGKQAGEASEELTKEKQAGETAGGGNEEETADFSNALFSQQEYLAYQERLNGIGSRDEIAQNGFAVMEEQVFEITLENFGEVTFLPALEETYRRLVLFFADAEGKIVYRTDQLEMNFFNSGALAQPIRRISAVSFQDVNGDGSTDIVLIASCENESSEKPFQIGEILFAKEEGFYRDWRISDKINRFGMNKSIDFIIAYARDGKSTEFLYTATTLEELQKNGFTIISEQSYTREFEKLGKLLVVPGSITIASYEVFMIYLVDEQGTIVWSFQPMGMHDNLYALRGINCRDIDGDGLKDIVVLARYSDESAPGQQQIVSDYAVYYQRTGGFSEDAAFKKQYTCDENTKMEDLVKAAREYWGFISD